MHPELLKRTVQACRDYMEAGDCHGEPPPIERLIDAVVQLAGQIPQMLVRHEEYDSLSPAARERLGEVAEAARRKAAVDYHEGRARLAGVSLGTPAAGVQGRVEALGAEIDQKLSKYDEPQTFSPELEAAADAALARLAGNAGVMAVARSCSTCANHGDGKRVPGVIGTPCDNCAPPPRLSNWTPAGGVPASGEAQSSESRALILKQAAAMLDYFAANRRRLMLESADGVDSDEADPLNTPLPCDVNVGHTTFRKGVALRSLVLHADRLRDELHTRWADALTDATAGVKAPKNCPDPLRCICATAPARCRRNGADIRPAAGVTPAQEPQGEKR